MQSGSRLESNNKLSFERATNANALSDFSCGIESIDNFLHNELQDYLNMGSCSMYLVKEDKNIVAMFCLEKSNLTLSEPAKENMQNGAKPIPQVAPDSDDPYWYKVFYDAVEISYLAVASNRQHQHIGSYIIEQIMSRVAQSSDCKEDFVIVRALNQEDYTAIPFYKECGFYPAQAEVPNQNLFMYRVVLRK